MSGYYTIYGLTPFTSVRGEDLIEGQKATEGSGRWNHNQIADFGRLRPSRSLTGDTTLAAADVGRLLLVDAATAPRVTLPANLEAGLTVQLYNVGATTASLMLEVGASLPGQVPPTIPAKWSCEVVVLANSDGQSAEYWLRLTPPPEITPQQFGAVGDGVTDDTVAMLAWFDAIEARVGTAAGDRLRPVGRLPIGVYLCRQKLQARAEVEIVGEGDLASSILFDVPGDFGMVLEFRAQNCIVRDLGIYNPVGNGLRIQSPRSSFTRLRSGKGLSGTAVQVEALHTNLTDLYITTNGQSVFGGLAPPKRALVYKATDENAVIPETAITSVSTTAGSKLVTVASVAAVQSGQVVTIRNPAAEEVGGITLGNGQFHTVYSVGSGEFTIKHDVAATSTATGGAGLTVELEYIGAITPNMSTWIGGEIAGCDVGVWQDGRGHGDTFAVYWSILGGTSQGNGINNLMLDVEGATVTNLHSEGSNIGKFDLWQPATAYALDDIVRTSDDNLYLCVVAGTSDVTEPSEQSASGQVTDGGAAWDWLGRRPDQANESFDWVLYDVSACRFIGGDAGKISLAGNSHSNLFLGTTRDVVLVGEDCIGNEAEGGYGGVTGQGALHVYDRSGGMGWTQKGGMVGNPDASLSGNRLTPYGKAAAGAGLVHPWYRYLDGDAWESVTPNSYLPLGGGRCYWQKAGTVNLNKVAAGGTDRLWEQALEISGAATAEAGVEFVIPPEEFPRMAGGARLHLPLTWTAILLTEEAGDPARVTDPAILLHERNAIKRTFPLDFPETRRAILVELSLKTNNLDLTFTEPVRIGFTPSRSGAPAGRMVLMAMNAGFQHGGFGFATMNRAEALNGAVAVMVGARPVTLFFTTMAQLPPTQAYAPGSVGIVTDATPGTPGMIFKQTDGSWVPVNLGPAAI